MITIVDYGVGNVQAFLNLFKRSGIDARCAKTVGDLHGSTHLILPGVGHFDRAMEKINNSGLRPKLDELVLAHNVKVLGICVGMQMLAEGSDEGTLPGLSWIPGRVRALENDPKLKGMPLPHMGWNTVDYESDSSLFAEGFDGEANFYFLHSYYFDATDNSHVAGVSEYGLKFPSVVSKLNIHGIQCHPEKSHRWGEQILVNFGNL
jgi:glutamine amidotransferase